MNDNSAFLKISKLYDYIRLNHINIFSYFDEIIINLIPKRNMIGGNKGVATIPFIYSNYTSFFNDMGKYRERDYYIHRISCKNKSVKAPIIQVIDDLFNASEFMKNFNKKNIHLNSNLYKEIEFEAIGFNDMLKEEI
ncbi:MAG: hypothetical protein H7Y18_12870 [Clostridiaceae bacterium]|nr:hypothetical protein [Clostridiaceae bacterium]